MRLLSNQVKRLIAVFALITAACLGVIILSAVRVVNTRDAFLCRSSRKCCV